MSRRHGWAAALTAVLLPQIPTQLDAGPGLILAVAVLGALMMVAMAAAGIAVAQRVWIPVVGLILMPVMPFASAAIVDTPLFGPVVTSTVDTAPLHRWASAYRLTDAVVRPDLAGGVSIHGTDGRGRWTTAYVFVTPVLSAGGGPARIWLLNDDGRAYQGRTNLTVARLVGSAGDQETVQMVARRNGLDVPADVLLVRPVDDPGAVWWTGWLKLAALAGAAIGAWMLLQWNRRRFSTSQLHAGAVP
jgi:hypothetical protein